MKPNPKYLGKNCSIIADDLMEWLDNISYLIPSDIVIKLGIKKKGKESLVNKKYSNKYGLYDLVKKKCNKSLVDPVHFKRDMKMKEQVGEKLVDRFMGIEVAMTYNTNSTEFDGISFCNFIITTDNGVHLDACKTATLQYLTKQTKEALSERESKKIDITFADATQGLYLAIYLCTDFQPNFNSQAKAKLTSNEFFKPIRDLTYRALNDYFKDNQKDLKKITDRIKTNAKARIESTKVRNSVIKGESNNFSEHLMENFIPANDKSKNGYRELFIIEGKSARGTCESGRFDRNTQAVFSIRGVPLNAFNTSLDKVLLNDEFKSLTQILGCNIGARFDISKLKYDKIILLADADSDGYNITSLLCAFFLTHLPKIIEDGRLYKSISPLYRIKSKYKEFILNKKEYIQIFEKHIRENLIIEDAKTHKVYNKDEMQELLMNTKGYLDELLRLSNHLVIDYTILEYLLIHRKENNFYKNFKKKFPELEIDNENVLSGIYEGKYQILIMDKLFENRVAHLEKFILNQKEASMYFNVRDKNNIDYGTLTLGQFLFVCQKYQPVIKTRYKGIGELNSNDLRDNTLDPRHRMLIRLTIDDIEKELEQFNILHGDNADARKLLMQNYKIDREELDN